AQQANIWHDDTTDGDDIETLLLEAGTLLLEQTVTDADGDSDTAAFDLGAAGAFTIEDDGPEIAPQSFGSIQDGQTSSDISLESLFGTDGAGGITFDASINGTAVTQDGQQVLLDGEALTWSLSGDVLTATTASNVDAVTITLNEADGDYDISVAEGTFYLEGDRETFDIASLSGSNAEAWAAQTDGIDILIVSEGTSTNTSSAGGVGYVGAGSNWIDSGTSESTTFYFVTIQHRLAESGLLAA
ncbi:hypothetical protein LWH48_18145, partial [Halomonas sp. G15]|uniref:DUF5801 repeats-in-toxin domain-containing protein n=1 Tax=Halomonas sp. G15 TaxID=2903521 RepID=UPI001E6438D5